MPSRDDVVGDRREHGAVLGGVREEIHGNGHQMLPGRPGRASEDAGDREGAGEPLRDASKRGEAIFKPFSPILCFGNVRLRRCLLRDWLLQQLLTIHS